MKDEERKERELANRIAGNEESRCEAQSFVEKNRRAGTITASEAEMFQAFYSTGLHPNIRVVPPTGDDLANGVVRAKIIMPVESLEVAIVPLGKLEDLMSDKEEP